MQDFRKLKVWECAHRLVLDVYPITKSFPKEELFHLTSQIRRAACSIPSNIAEGCGRASDADFARFLSMSLGSACELDYQLLLARDLAYLTESDHTRLHAQVVEVRRMLAALLGSIRAPKPIAPNQ